MSRTRSDLCRGLFPGHGADTWGESGFGLDMRSAEDAVRSSALEWTVLRAANVDQNFDEENFHALLVAGELALPAGDVPEPFLDIEDLADVATTVLTEPGRHAQRVYELTGPRALTFPEAVDLISRASGLSMTYRQIPPPEYTATLVDQGLSRAAAEDVTAMFAMMDRGLLAQTTQDVATVLGRTPRSSEDYVVRAASADAWQRGRGERPVGERPDADADADDVG